MVRPPFLSGRWTKRRGHLTEQTTDQDGLAVANHDVGRDFRGLLSGQTLRANEPYAVLRVKLNADESVVADEWAKDQLGAGFEELDGLDGLGLRDRGR